MPTITWEAYVGTPEWVDIGSNRLVFSGSSTNHSTAIITGEFQSGTHLGSGTPGSDECGSNHANNVKLVSSTEMSLNGAATEDLNDTNLTDNECSFRLHFNDAVDYAIQNAKIYAYDGIDIDTPATGVDAALYVKGEGMTEWHTLNSDTDLGPAISGMGFETASVGGQGSGLDLADRAADSDHFYYCAVSVAPETSGGKANFALGAYLEYY